METFLLNTNAEIPVVGSGTNTFGKENHTYQGEINNDTTELRSAIQLGYRHFDTAIAYRNEAVVGKALRDSGLPLSDFFITSKIPGTKEYRKPAAVKQAVASSLENLGVEAIDLYLIHHPWEDFAEIAAVWQVLEECVEEGKLKAIGVSNFQKLELEYLLNHSDLKPAVNQIESHPGKWNDEIIDYCQKNGIVPEAWGPLSKVSAEVREILTTIGAPYNKSWSQVILRYQYERGVVTIPKSHSAEHQAENLAVFDFQLTPEDHLRIQAL